MMHPVYELLVNEVTEDIERKVLGVLIEHAGQRVTRPDLVFGVFGKYVQNNQLANNYNDRRVREAIERLQQREFPILASSGAAGYVLAADDSELDAYLAEIISRQNQLMEKERALRRSRKWIKYIQEYKHGQPAKQMSMFNKPVRMP